MRSTINLIKGDKIGSETDYRDALPVNMYGVARPMFGAAGYMIQYPGLTQYGTAVAADRGGVWNERFAQLYRVSGGSFLSVDDSGGTSILGAVSGSENVALPYSFNTQGVVAGGNFYLYDSSLGFRQVTDPDLGSPIDCVWINGYYFFTDGEYIYHTDINDEAAIDPLKFATAEFMPDKSLGVAKTQDNKVVIFGRYSTEYFQDRAQTNFAFQRIESRALKIGIVGTHCKVEVAGRFYILGGRKEECVSAHSVGVGSTQKVATREIDKIIAEYSEAELFDSVVESYTEDGYTFVVYHLPRHTLLFNQTLAESVGITQAWSILKSDIGGDNPYRGYHLVFDPRRAEWVCGDRSSASLGILDSESALHYGNISEWLLFTPAMYLEDQSIDQLEIETIPGHTGSDDATVFVSLSYDGVTHGKEWTQMYGEPNRYSQRFVLYRLGYVRDWVTLKLRGATRSRMAFARGFISHG